MSDELESPEAPYEDLSFNLDGLDDETVYLIYRNFIATNMTETTLSRFDQMIYDNDGTLTLEDIVSSAVLNEAIIQILEAQLANESGPIPPFNI